MEDYRKYRWFFTSKGNLVVGGKNAEQNDLLMNKIKEDYYVMHTKEPGSPFSVIICDKEKVSPAELEEVAIFTGCFSRAWRDKKKKVSVDLFTRKQMRKDKTDKVGTWRVEGKLASKIIDLKLILTKQKNVLRAVPEKTAKEGLVIYPGKIDKKDIIPQIVIEMDQELSTEEILSALPSGGIRIKK